MKTLVCGKCGKEPEDWHRFSILDEMCYECQHTCDICEKAVEPLELWVFNDGKRLRYGHRKCILNEKEGEAK